MDYCLTWSPLLLFGWELRGLAIQSCRAGVRTRFQDRLCSTFRTRTTPGWGGDVVRQDQSAGQREARAIHSRRRLPAGEPCGSRSAITAAPSAASTLAPSSSAPVTTPSGLGIYVGAAMLSKISYSPLRPPLPPVTKDSAKVRTVPVPLKGPSRGSATSAPKQHGVGGERRG